MTFTLKLIKYQKENAQEITSCLTLIGIPQASQCINTYYIYIHIYEAQKKCCASL